MSVHRRHLAAADAVLLLGEDDDRAAFRRFVGERRELRRIGELALRYARQRDELRGLTVAEGDRAGLVEKKGIDVSRRLDRPAGHREHVEANETIHAGDADRREQRTDGRRDQGHEQRHEHEHAECAPGIGREAGDGGDGEDEDDRHAGEQNVERDLVRRLLPLRALDESDHPVEERRAGCRGDAHLDPVGDHLRSAGDRRTVAAALADHRRRLAGDRRLVDRGDAVDHLAVARDEVAGLDQDDIARLQLGRRHLPPCAPNAEQGASPSFPSSSFSASPPAPCRGPRQPPPRSWRTAR